MFILLWVMHKCRRDDWAWPRNRRDQRRKSRAFARGAFDLDGTAVADHEPVTDRQTESGSHAHGFGGKERFEDLFQILRQYAASGVADFHKHHFVLHASFNANFARAGTKRLRGIHEQVHPYLFELAGKAID